MQLLPASTGWSPARCLPRLQAAMQRPRAISAWSVSLKLLKLIGQGCPRNFADMGGYDLAVGIDEDRGRKDAVAGHVHEAHLRSEEHMSELQSLMRISYAV